MELINTDAAKQSNLFTFTGVDNRPATLFVKGLGSGEYVDLQFTVDNGTTWTNVYVNGTQVRFSETANTMWMNVRGKYRLNKASTAGTVVAVLIQETEGV